MIRPKAWPKASQNVVATLAETKHRDVLSPLFNGSAPVLIQRLYFSNLPLHLNRLAVHSNVFVMVTLHRQALSRRYKASCCSCSFFYYVLGIVVLVVLPFFLAYTSQGKPRSALTAVRLPPTGAHPSVCVSLYPAQGSG
jgi:hypothetical protein